MSISKLIPILILFSCAGTMHKEVQYVQLSKIIKIDKECLVEGVGQKLKEDILSSFNLGTKCLSEIDSPVSNILVEKYSIKIYHYKLTVLQTYPKKD